MILANTPKWLLDACLSFFKELGYSVEVNFPYDGCLVPSRFEGDRRVPAIMLEGNRRLYLEPVKQTLNDPCSPPMKSAEFQTIKNDIWTVILRVAHEASNRLELSPHSSKIHA